MIETKKHRGRPRKLLFSEGLEKMSPKIEKHLFLSDFHIPDHNKSALMLSLKFISIFKPDKLHIVGDFLNFSKISKFDQDPYYDVDIVDEIDVARNILKELILVTRNANPHVEINWFEGNHEARLMKFLGHSALQLAELNLGGEKIISVPHLFQLKELGVSWHPIYQPYFYEGMSIQHGGIARIKAGYTAQASIDKLGIGGFSGHTHRLAFSPRTQAGKTKIWIETGCLCNLQPFPAYAISPDWQQGFAIGYFDKVSKVMYPYTVPILNDKIVYGGYSIS